MLAADPTLAFSGIPTIPSGSGKRKATGESNRWRSGTAQPSTKIR